MFNYEQILQNELNYLCDSYNLEKIKVKVNSSLFVTTKEKRKYMLGQLDLQKKRIILNEKLLLEKDGEIELVKGLYHEFRHYWQYQNYREVYLRWLSTQNREAYNKYYYTDTCSIEADAREFGDNFGNFDREDLLKKDNR